MFSVIIDSVSNPNISALKTVTKKKFLRNYPLQIYRSHEQTHFLYILGVANGTSKNVGLEKFCQDLEISKAFMISLEVSFFHGLFLLF